MMKVTTPEARAIRMAGYISAVTILRFTVAMIFVYSTKRRSTVSRPPLRSPASSEAV